MNTENHQGWPRKVHVCADVTRVNTGISVHTYAYVCICTAVHPHVYTSKDKHRLCVCVHMCLIKHVSSYKTYLHHYILAYTSTCEFIRTGICISVYLYVYIKCVCTHVYVSGAHHGHARLYTPLCVSVCTLPCVQECTHVCTLTYVSASICVKGHHTCVHRGAYLY